MFVLLNQTVPIDIDEVVDTSDVTEWDLVGAVATLVVAAILGRVLAALARRAGRKALLPANLVDLISTVVVWSTVTAGAVMGLTMIGLNATPLWFLILLFLVMFAIGGRALIEGFGAGVMLQARAPFSPGDLVELANHTGVVVEVNSRVVVLDSVDGRRMYLPNQQILGEEIVNLSTRRGRMSEVVLDVEYGTDLDRACSIAADAASRADGLRSDPAPTALVTSFEASAVRISLRFWHAADVASEWAAVDGASRAAYAAFAANGVGFAFPQQTLWWGNGQRPDGGGPDRAQAAS